MDAGPRHGPDHRSSPRGIALLIWCAALALLATMAVPLIRGQVYTYDDLGCFHLPVRAFYSEQLARHEPFDWMPGLFCGFYLTGEGQAGTYHPLHWLLYRVAPLDVAWPLEVLSSYPFLLVGMWLLLRRRLSPAPAAFGALGFTFSAFNLLHFVHPNAIAIVAHIPWLLWAIDIALTATEFRRRGAALLAIALLTGSQLLLGYPQYVWFSLLAEAVWIAIHPRIAAPGQPRVLPRVLSNQLALQPRALPGGLARQLPGQSERLRSCSITPLSPCGRGAGGEGADAPKPCLAAWRPWVVILGCFAAAKLLGLLLGSVQILPTVDALTHAARRAAGSDFVNQGALHAFNLVQLVSPYFFAERAVGITPHEAGLYLGAVPLALLVWLRTSGPAWRRVPGANLLGLLGILALVLAFGPAGQLYRLQQFLPLVNSFRCPCRYLVLFQLTMLILAAAAFGQLVAQCQKHKPCPWSRLRGLMLLAVVAMVVMFIGFALRVEPLVAGRRWMVAGAATVIVAALLVAGAARGYRLALLGLVLWCAADLGAYGVSYAVFRDAEPLAQYRTLALVPPVKPGPRMAADLIPFGDWAPRSGNQMLLAGWSRVDGYAGLEPARQLDYQTLAALRVAHVGWVRRTPLTEGIAGLQPHDAHWLRVPNPLAYVRLASAAVLSTQPGRDLPNIPIESTVLVERPVDRLPAGENGQARLVDHRPEQLAIEVDAPARRVLAVAESFHPGWKTTIDGRDASTLRVNGDFLGCLVEPGQHRVVLEFRPASLALGRALSVVGMGLVLAAGAWLLVRSRPRLV
jgi:hypothetical protein